MPIYPTKEEILTNPPKIKASTIQIVKDWKIRNWPQYRNQTNNSKSIIIAHLLIELSRHYEKPVSISQVSSISASAYNPITKTIILDPNKPSIISALHELGHHLFEASELKACRWSITIFKKIFPIAYSRLVWNGHLLIKPQNV